MSGVVLPRTDAVVHSLRRFVPAYVSSHAAAWWIHRVRPFHASGKPAHQLRRLQRIVAAMPRTEVIEATDEYLHAVCRTLLGFRDDLEFRFSPAERVVHVQSASRVGLFDFGVNRRRVERVRKGLARFS